MGRQSVCWQGLGLIKGNFGTGWEFKGAELCNSRTVSMAKNSSLLIVSFCLKFLISFGLLKHSVLSLG